MVSGAHRLTYEDYLLMPDNGHRYEIIEGELFVSPSPSLRHQIAARNLLILLATYVRAHGLGTVLSAPFTVRITPDEPVEPDLFFVRQEREYLLDEGAMNGAPDLVVEIVSPSGRQYDRVTKFNRYAQVGVAEYWIVDPIAEAVEQYALREGGYTRLRVPAGTISSGVIPRLDIPVEAIFVR